MKVKETIPTDMISADNGPPERGYRKWKQAKIERALAQAEDRSSLIPAEQVWRDLGLER